jgi:hemoglobin
MLDDPIVKQFFENVDMNKQRKRQATFITMVCGGPNNYEGTDMVSAHKKFKIG